MHTMVAWLRRLGALSTMLSACSCASTWISAQHAPLYEARLHDSTINVAAGSNTAGGGVARIEVWAIVGEITACTELGFLPSVIPCRRNATLMGRTCTFPAATWNAACPLTLNGLDQRLVTYVASTESISGKRSSTEPITYAAGTSLTQVSIGVPSDQVSMDWEVARPIWWHTETMPTQLPQFADLATPRTARDRLDIGFFPSSDYPVYPTYADDLEAVVLGAHFNSASEFSQSYSFYASLFDLWAGPPGAVAIGSQPATATMAAIACDQTFSGFAATVGAFMDGRAVVHDAVFRDCGDLTLGGGSGSLEGRWFALPDNNPPSQAYTHESGHFLHGLADEYCCDGGYTSISTPKNVYDSKDECVAVADAEGFDRTKCVQIMHTLGKSVGEKWKIDDGSSEIMSNYSAASSWRDASGRAVWNRFQSCLSGTCYP